MSLRTLSDHLTDIAQNSIKAGATLIKLQIKEDEHSFYFCVQDNAGGMNEETLAKIFDPFYTSRDKKIRRVGLGLPFLKDATELTGGYTKLESKLGEGTKTEALFIKDNIDCQPVGEIAPSLFSLISTSPDIIWEIKRIYKEEDYEINTKSIVESLPDKDIYYSPDFLNILQEGVTQMEEACFE